MGRLETAQEAMKQERRRLQRDLRARVAMIPPPAASIGLAWGDYLRQIVALCARSLDAFFAFILGLWTPRNRTPTFRSPQLSRWNEVVRQELDSFHDFVHKELVSACGASRLSSKKVAQAALDLLEQDCEPLRAAINQHFSSNVLLGNCSRLNRWIMMLTRRERMR